MTPAQAIAIITECIEAGRIELHQHFIDRLAQRGLFWPDVLTIVETWIGARDDGMDDLGRPRWLVRGKVVDNLIAEFLAVLDRDDCGNITVFITVYFED